VISVAIPAYKSRHLRSAIESVLSQAFGDFELIILNDGSPEDVRTIVAGCPDPRIRYFENEVNIGGKDLIRCWNRCLELAKGEYFVLFSDDDVYHPEFLTKLHGLAVRKPAVHVFHCRVRIIGEGGEELGLTPVCPEEEGALEFVWNAVQGRRKQFVPDFLYRTESLRKTGGFHDLPLAWGSDYVTSFRMAALGGVAYTPEVLFEWRKSSAHLSAAGDIARRIDALEGYRKWLEDFLTTLPAEGPVERATRDRCLRALPAFFRFKREWLLNRKLAGQSAGQSLVHVRSYAKSFYLSPGRVLFRILRTALSRMNPLPRTH
jgi:glycosyltransferase involved in cell wall biosynthesis